VQCGLSSALMLLLLVDMCTYKNDIYLRISVLYTSVFLISDGWEIISDQPARPDEIT
jgi:hypothetical protein